MASTLNPNQGQQAETPPRVDLDPGAMGELENSLRKPRTLFSVFLSAVVTILTLLALVPLFSVIIMLFLRGGFNLAASNFWTLPPSAVEEGGGFGNALVGTLVMVTIAGLISVPFGMMAAVFLAELGPNSRTATVVRFCAKVLSGLPACSHTEQLSWSWVASPRGQPVWLCRF